MNRKRRMALLLALFMFASLMPLSAAAEEYAAEGPGSGLIQLVFTGAQGEELKHVTLLDAAGNVVLPLSDAPGSYLLAPGQYSYYLIVPTDGAGIIPVTALTLDGETDRVEIALRAAPIPQDPADDPAALPAPPQAELSSQPQAMPVIFRCDSRIDFAGLTVTNASGAVMQPYTDPLTGQMQFENYLLAPGAYSYWYHDPAGVFSDQQESFTVTEGGVQYVTVKLTDGAVEGCYSATAVNPHYADVIRADFIPAPLTSPEESLAELLLEIGDLSTLARRDEMRAVYGADSPASGGETYETSPVVFDSAEAAGAALKRGLIQRQTEIPIRVKCRIKPTEEIWWEMCWMIYDAAIRHTGAPTEGDYLRYEYGGVNCNGSAAGTDETGVYYYKFIYSPLYFTSHTQEMELSAHVSAILNSLELNGKSDEQKIRAVYQYLCEHVQYEETRDTLIFTAYSALVNGRAACQGISVAFYRLCLELGLDARIVTSKEMGHAWNIVRADGKNYYAVDATWDCGRTPEQWRFYLKGRDSWKTEHSTGDEFADGRFAAYSFPDGDYGTSTDAVIHSVSLLFDGMLRIKYYFILPDSLVNEQGSAIQFSRGGSAVYSVPLAEGRREGSYTCFYCSVNAEDMPLPIQARIQKRDGSFVTISSQSGTSYPNGFFFSPMEYAQNMKTAGSTPAMRALAQALEDYGIAAQNYFKKSNESLRDVVKAVTASDLDAWTTATDGTKPAGFSAASISVMFEADNTLRIYLQFDRDADLGRYSYTVDGQSAALQKKSDGAFYLSVENIAADALDTVHQFTVSDGTDSYRIKTSVLGYAKTAIEHGTANMADLGRALYLYNRAAENYFGA